MGYRDRLAAEVWLDIEAVAVGALVAAPFGHKIFELLSAPAAPAWAQAIGSVAAIFVAIWLQDRQRRVSVSDTTDAVVALARDLRDVVHAADHVGRKHGYTEARADTLAQQIRSRVAMLRGFDHTRYSASAFEQVLRILTVAEQAAGFLEAVSAEMIGKANARFSSELDWNVKELKLAVEDLEDAAGLEHADQLIVRTALPD